MNGYKQIFFTVALVGMAGVSSGAWATGGSGFTSSICYSTGPLENEFAQSNSMVVKVLNNNNTSPVLADVSIFGLNGSKIGVDGATLGPIPAGASDFLNTGNVPPVEFEVQVRVKAGSGAVKGAISNTLVGVFPKTNGLLNPAHRVVHSELVKIPCSFFDPFTPPAP